MSTLLPIMISWLQSYGYPALWLSIFVAAIGAPLPVSLVLLAAGAFSALGDFNILLLGLIAVSASVVGDSVGYVIGRHAGSKLLNWLAQRRRFGFISPAVMQRSQSYFHKRGGLAVFLSRFLIPALGGTINLLAGSEAYPYRRFLAFDIAGETLGAALPLALGYTFSASWDAIGDVMSSASLLVLALLVALYLCKYITGMLKHMKAKKAALQELPADSVASFREISKRG